MMIRSSWLGGALAILVAVAAPAAVGADGPTCGRYGTAVDWYDDEDAARAVRFTIAKRAGRSSDIGPLAVWLAGGGGGYVSGQAFALDGGLLQHL